LIRSMWPSGIAHVYITFFKLSFWPSYARLTICAGRLKKKRFIAPHRLHADLQSLVKFWNIIAINLQTCVWSGLFRECVPLLKIVILQYSHTVPFLYQRVSATVFKLSIWQLSIYSVSYFLHCKTTLPRDKKISYNTAAKKVVWKFLIFGQNKRYHGSHMSVGQCLEVWMYRLFAYISKNIPYFCPKMDKERRYSWIIEISRDFSPKKDQNSSKE
jgi:hypothetical protein